MWRQYVRLSVRDYFGPAPTLDPKRHLDSVCRFSRTHGRFQRAGRESQFVTRPVCLRRGLIITIILFTPNYIIHLTEIALATWDSVKYQLQIIF